MEPKNRMALAIAVILLIVGAMTASFGRSLFALNTPSIQLPSQADSSQSGDSSQSHSGSGQYHRVEVTPQTVQSVIATLTRSDSYYRELTVEILWEDGSSMIPVQAWTDGGWTHTRKVLPSGSIRHDLIGDGTLYYWYEGYHTYLSAPADELSSDLSQRLPTYETVLQVDEENITAAGYETRGELPCVFVEVTLEEEDVVERYWIGVDSGLLVSAETDHGGQTVYRMTAYSPVTTPCPSSASFQLPDGTVFHSLTE